MIKYTQAPNFKGFKRIPLVVIGIDEAENNSAVLQSMSFKNATIKCVPNPKCVAIYVNDLLIGIVFDNEYVSKIVNKRYEALYARMEEETIVGKGSITKRYRGRLFGKEKERGWMLNECKKITKRILESKGHGNN